MFAERFKTFVVALLITLILAIGTASPATSPTVLACESDSTAGGGC